MWKNKATCPYKFYLAIDNLFAEPQMSGIVFFLSAIVYITHISDIIQ